jgi:phage terminase small subunit
MPLNPKQKRFADEYLVDLNATQAAIRTGYSKKTARSQGQRLLTKDDIQSYIGKRYQGLVKKGKILTPEEVLEGYTRDATFDTRKLYKEDGSLKKVTELDDDTALAIAGIEVEVKQDGTEVRKYKIPNRHVNRDSLSKYHGLFEKDNLQRAPEWIAVILAALPEPVREQVTAAIKLRLTAGNGK